MALKVLRLESYEDALENLAGPIGPAGPDAVRYRQEPGSGAWTIDPVCFRNPWRATLAVRRRGRRGRVAVDLIETFNWLLGLRVRRRVRVGDGLLVVEGRTRDGPVRVLWRDADLVTDDDLDRHLAGPGDGIAGPTPGVVSYVNGLGPSPSRGDGGGVAVRSIEPEFVRRLFSAPPCGWLLPPRRGVATIPP